MKKSERYLKGEKLLTQLHGGHAGEEIINAFGEICPAMAEMTIEWGFGEIMSRQGLDLKTRELAIIASLVTLGNTLPQLKAHIEAALSVGATKDEIIEIILQTALYAGFPVAANAMITAKEILMKKE